MGDDDLIHVYPTGDLREHVCAVSCWCNPVEDDGIVIHNAMDGREAFETGERKPS